MINKIGNYTTQYICEYGQDGHLTKSYLLINNPTNYDPTKIVVSYVENQKTSVSKEIDKLSIKGIHFEKANQDLFVRAVRAYEYNKNFNLLAKLLVVYVFYDFISRRITDSILVAIPTILIAYAIYYIALLISYWLLSRIADRLGINFQYSI